MTPEPHACPKCGCARAQAEGGGACPICGLRLERWGAFRDEPSPHPGIDPAFSTLADRWEDPKAHDAFLALARAEAALDAAAARYRHRLRAQPDDAQAQRALAQAVLVAAQLKDTAARDSLVGLRRLRLAITLAAFFLIVALTVVVYRVLARGFPRSL